KSILGRRGQAPIKGSPSGVELKVPHQAISRTKGMVGKSFVNFFSKVLAFRSIYLSLTCGEEYLLSISPTIILLSAVVRMYKSERWVSQISARLDHHCLSAMG